MGSFSAELQVAGYVLPVLRCDYGASQGTDGRGRVNTKLRHSRVELLLDVPDHDLLLAWAAAPAKRLAVDVVFRADASGSALETLHLAGAYCVGYREVFESGDTGGGAYQCVVTLTDPGGWTLTAGGPGGPFQAPASRSPSVAEGAVLVAPEAVAEVVAESAWARLGAGLLRVLEAGASFPALLAALLLMPQTANAPGLPQHPPLLNKEALRLAELERRHHAGEALSQDEQAEYLSLLARVRGVHLGSLHNSLADQLRADHLRKVVPDFREVHLAGTRGEAIGEFDGVNMAEKLFIENKSAQGLTTLNPRTGQPFQSAAAWADTQLYNKTAKRIQALKTAKYTYPPGSPGIEQIRNFRHLHFRVDADTPELRQAVDDVVGRLRTENPGWEFTSQYGTN